MTKLFILLALAVALHAEDKPAPNIDLAACVDGPKITLNSDGCRAALKSFVASTPEIAELKAENERLTKLLNAYYQKYQACDTQLTQLQVIGPPPPTKPEAQK